MKVPGCSRHVQMIQNGGYEREVRITENQQNQMATKRYSVLTAVECFRYGQLG